ncbi:MAG: FkbM family methyltransferase [Fimbriimonadaceae bacterium]|nr:FkbM family methyltransferase [Fimbriimonadaceae bacterium]
MKHKTISSAYEFRFDNERPSCLSVSRIPATEMKCAFSSLRGFLNTRRLNSRLERPPLTMDSPVPGTGVSVRFAVHTWLEYHNRARGSYEGEPDLVDWLQQELRSGDVFWDVGANVGAYTVLAAKLCSDATVVAWEPFIPTFAHLWENLALNGCAAQVLPLEMGLSDASAVSALAVHDPRAGSSQHRLGDETDGLRQRLVSVRGEDAAAWFGIPAPTLLKVDTDGHEAAVFRGMGALLRRPELRSILVEVDPRNSEKEILGLLGAAGFRCVENPQAVPVNGIVNARFVRA